MVSAVAILAVFAAPAVRADVGLPTWTAGDYWEYTITGFDIPGLPPPTGTLRVNVTGTDSVTVGSTTYTTYRTTLVFSLTVTISGVTATFTINGQSWYRTTDLGVVKEVVTFPAFGGGNPTTTTTVYSPPAVMQWPLRAGATWTTTSVVESTTTGFPPSQSTYVMSVSVQQETSLTVPAGSFTAAPVRTDLEIEGFDGGYTMEFWSASVGSWVRMQQFSSSGSSTPQMSSDLKSYNYQAGGLFGAGGIWLILLLLIIIVVIIAAAVLARRRKAAPAMPPQGWQQPGMPPQQQWQPPPQQPQQPWQPPQQPPPGQ